jgi:acetamidase/formamidase
MKNLLAGAILIAASAYAADLSGEWIAEISSGGDPQYARVALKSDGAKLSGTWNGSPLEGAVSTDSITLTPPGGSLTAKGVGTEWKGSGKMAIRQRQNDAAEPQQVAFKLTKIPAAPASPRTIDFAPKEFQRYYSASIPPVLHLFPKDTVRTYTIDAGGLDSKLQRRSPGGNAETGPFYIEGALPGDTLVVKLNKLKLNRDTARQGNRINGRVVTPAYNAAAKYTEGFNSEWTLDRAAGVARLSHPTERLKNFTIPLKPMIGCLATAPAGNLVYRTTDLGPFGGNMDYNEMGEGATLYLPVFHPGALFFLGDTHAAMGDAELTGSALETSMDVEFTVDLIKGSQTAGPRLENADYLMSMGIAGSVPDSIQIATSQLATWLKDTYKLNDSEVAVLLGAVAKYDITELVDSSFNVVAKVPKSALAPLAK